jgi:ABC-type multidrug transport system fused ATPase/permease subunit
MSFFDENTSGRIINRLSKDISVLDSFVFNFLDMLDYIIKCLISTVFIVGSSPLSAFVVAFQLWYYVRLSRRILKITTDCFKLL